MRTWWTDFDCSTHSDCAIWPLGSCSQPHLIMSGDEKETPWNSVEFWKYEANATSSEGRIGLAVVSRCQSRT